MSAQRIGRYRPATLNLFLTSPGGPPWGKGGDCEIMERLNHEWHERPCTCSCQQLRSTGYGQVVISRDWVIGSGEVLCGHLVTRYSLL